MNHTTSSHIFFPNHLSIPQLFEEIVAKNPKKTALISENETLTYADFNAKSNQLAQHLQSKGIGKEDFVALCLDRSIDMLIGIFAILKAGGAYVPVDVDYPTQRLQFMLEDAQAKVILTEQKHLARIPSTDAHIFVMDTDWQTVEQYSTANDYIPIAQPEDLAYCIYTSGSTGKPKGVMLTHENVMNQLEGQQEIAPIPISKMLLTCSISFDVSVLTIFWTILQGSTLVLPEQGEEKDIQRLANLVERHQVTHILTLPSLHTLILEQAPPHKLRSLQLVNVSGEVCPTAMTQKHERLIPHCQLYNLYGPTEATVNCTFFTIPKGFSDEKVPIGIPIKHYEIFILNEELQPVGDGEVGEIYIGGTEEILARGYWNRPELSAERFIQNPFYNTDMPLHGKRWTADGGRQTVKDNTPISQHLNTPTRTKTLYKTGDLARWMPDGNVEFLGRIDYQVKFRGFRIELGEIEVAIGLHPSVKETVVVLQNQHQVNQQKLVAYLCLHPNLSLNVSEIRAFLEEKLPDYMLPTAFVFLPQMPLTTNGKIDRQALPEPTKLRPVLEQAFIEPSGNLEKHLAKIWEKLLEISPIGRHDKFFELGGNSIQAAQFIGELQQQLDAPIFITTIFDNPTIAEYAAMLEESYKEELSSFQPLSRSATVDKVSENFDNGSRTLSTVEADTNKKSVHRPPSTVSRSIKTFPQYLHTIQEFNNKTIQQFSNSAIKQLNHPPIFILAPPRSGTSLLRVMLAGHPEIFGANELQLLHFNTLEERSQAYSGKFSLWLEGLVRAVMELKNCDADTAKGILQKLEQKGYDTTQVFQQLQEWAGDYHLLDKSPSYALDHNALKRSEQIFDQKAIYIHLVRHPYSMVKSFEKYHFDQVLHIKNHPFNTQELGELVWLQSHKNTVDFLQSIPKNRQFRLQYEELVAEPEKTMRQLCAQIGLDYHPSLIAPYQNLDQKMVDGIYKDSRSMSDDKLLKQKGINPKLAETWKKVKEDNFLSETTWELATNLGYPMADGGRQTIDETQLSNGEFISRNTIQTDANTDTHEHPNTLTPQHLSTPTQDIAIIGIACRLPGANTPHELWMNLVNGTEVGKQVTAEDLLKAGLDPNMLDDPNFVGRHYTLNYADCFDAKFFGYHPKEAEMMDPQHRVFLETAYSALQNAGYNPENYEGKIGIFGGVAQNTYFNNNIATHPDLLQSSGEYTSTIGSEKSFSITRVAYKLNLKGPAVNVQTACSSSGVGVHLACQSLLNGDSDMVMVGGGRIQPPLASGYEYTEGGPLSPDGTCKAFDADAKGMVRGNGINIIVLKKLDKAIEDGDYIYAVIKGTAINNDGSDKIGFTAPSIKGQAACIEAAQKKAGITADDIQYIETHGTGTRLGDPIELAALSQAFRKTTDKKQFCAISSIKTNIGHLDTGACVAGIIKTALSLCYELMPPTMHFKTPNPQIPFEKSPFYVNQRLQRWKRSDKPRRAGVSSFGLGGTNAHIILEEAPLIEHRGTDAQKHNLFLLSAKTENALEESTKDLSTFLQRKPETELSLTDAAYTLAIGRQHFQHRRAIIAKNHEEAIAALENVKNPNTVSGLQQGAAPSMVFLFAGGGAQYVEMAKDLYEENPIFRGFVEECLEILEANHGLEVRKFIAGSQAKNSPTPNGFGDVNESEDNLAAQLRRPSLALPTLLTIEYALAKLWQSWGITPSEMIGHSMGEYAAACIAGVFTIEEALALVYTRGKLFESLEVEGGMLSVPMTELEARKYMQGDLSFAAINKPNNCVISGTVGAIDALQQRLVAENIDAKRIHIKVAAHSPQVAPIMGQFHDFLQTINFQEPQIPFVSNVTGTWANPEEVMTAEYWVSHLRNTVRFSDGLEAIFALPNRVLLEVGPGQTLSTFARQHPAKNSKQLILASLRHPKEPKNDVEFLYKTVAKLWLEGMELDWKAFYANQNAKRTPLPTYPFERKRYWIEPFDGGRQTVDDRRETERRDGEAQRNGVQIEHGGTEIQRNGYHQMNTQPTNMNTLTQQNFNTLSTQTNMNTQTTNHINTSAVPRKERITEKIKDVLFELSGVEPEEMEEQATFLELGFDSLFLTQAITDINRQFELDLTFRQLFEEAPTIDALSEYIDGNIPADMFQEEVRVEMEEVGSEKQDIGGNGQVVESQVFAQQIPQPPVTNHQSPITNIQYPTSNGSAIENILSQQMALMQQQLALLQGQNLQQTPPIVQPIGQQTTSIVEQKANHQQSFSSNGHHSNNGVSQKPANKFTDTNTTSTPQHPNTSTQKEETPKAFGPWKPVSKNTAEITPFQERMLKEFLANYNERTKSSKALSQAQRKRLSDPRSIQAFNKLWKDGIYQIASSHSKGAKIYDLDGNEYVDFMMSFGIALFGHTPDFVQEAVTEQLAKGTELTVLTPLAKEVADLVCEITGNERATMVNTGSESLSAAVRAARTVTGKTRIAYFEGDYHGITDEMLGRPITIRGQLKTLPVAPGIPKASVENVLILSKDDPNLLNILRENAKDLAAVLVEPVQTQQPHLQQFELMKELRKVTEEENIALIFDEMVNGFRLHQRGAQAWYNIEVDICCYGKIVSGGLPMAIVAGKAKYLDAFDGGQWQYGDDSFPEALVTFYGGTFVKHPLCLASAKAALEHIKAGGPQLQEELNERGAAFARRLRDLFLETKAPLAIKSTSSILAVKIADGNPLSDLFFHALRYHGVHQTERSGFVSTAHTDEDLEFAFNAYKAAIQEMFDRGFFEPYGGEDLNLIVGSPRHLGGSENFGNGSKTLQTVEATTSNPLQLLPKSATVGKVSIPLTEGQTEIWLSNQLGNGASMAYNLSSQIRLEGDLNQPALERAIEKLVERHEALRTTFSEDGQTQLIHAAMEVNVPLLDLTGLNTDELGLKLKELHQLEAETAFDLSEGPLVRFKLIKINENSENFGNGFKTLPTVEANTSSPLQQLPKLEIVGKVSVQPATIHLLFLTVHHIVSDGWSLGILINDLGELYAQSVGMNAKDMKQPKQLSGYVLEEEKAKEGKAFQKSEAYWAKQFEGEIPVLELPTDRVRPPFKTFNSAMETLHLTKEEYLQLKKAGAKEGTTFYVLMYAAFQTFLHRLSGQDDFVLGVVAAGQAIAGNQDLVAHCVSVLPVRMQLQENNSFKAHLKQVRSTILDAFDHQNYTLGALVKKLKVARDVSRQPIVSVLFNMDSDAGKLNYANVTASTSPIPRNYETFDIFINIKVVADGLDFEWIYNTDLWDASTIQSRLAEWKVLLEGIVANPEQSLATLPMLPQSEQTQLLKWNDNQVAFPIGETAHQLVEKQAAKTPDLTALVFENEQYTYRELNEKCNQWAHYFRGEGLQSGDVVGIYLDRSAEMLMAILAVLKAGGTYLPIDPTNPKDRVTLMLEDAGAKWVICERSLEENIADYRGCEKWILEDFTSKTNAMSTANPTWAIPSKGLAYIIYTSGSTGKPKGVEISHDAVVDFLYGMSGTLQIKEKDVLLSVISMSFDPSIQDYFLTLMSGATLVLADKRTVKDGFLLKDKLEVLQPSMMQATPSTWQLLQAAGWEGAANLRVVSGGEGLPHGLARFLVDNCREVWNVYGPTEAIIWVTTQRVTTELLDSQKDVPYVSIGHAMPNIDLYVLDKHLQVVPIGAFGELHIGGRLAEGYHGRLELTAERFIQHPFKANEKLYKTGDLVRRLPNGDIVYLNRMDHQVKIRGHRIELGEIEAVISEVEGVHKNVVVVRKDSNDFQQLVAYLVMEAGQTMDIAMFQAHLGTQLPAYMLPNFYVELEAFPLSTAGKVNRKALPAPAERAVVLDEDRHFGKTFPQDAPKTETQEMLAGFWRKLLNVQQVGIHDNFFELGGHSLLAVQLIYMIKKATEKQLSLMQLLENATIAKIERLLDGGDNDGSDGSDGGDSPSPRDEELIVDNEKLKIETSLVNGTSIQGGENKSLQLSPNLSGVGEISVQSSENSPLQLLPKLEIAHDTSGQVGKVSVNGKTTSKLNGHSISKDESTVINHQLPITNHQSPIILPLTEGQQEIWLTHQLSREAAISYNLPIELRLKGVFEVEAMGTAMQNLVDRHEALRVTFDEDGQTQTIHPKEDVSLDVAFEDVSELDEDERMEVLAKIYEEAAMTPFDLVEDAVVRFKIVCLQSDEHLVLMTVHHIAADGWSMGVLKRDLGELYESALTGKNTLPPVSKQLSTFVEEEIEAQNSVEYHAAEAYWKKRFADEVPVLELPTDYAYSGALSFRAESEKLHFSEAEYEQIRRFAAQNGATFYMFMLSAFQAFVCRLAQQEDFVLGISVATQSIVENSDLVAHRPSVVPIRLTVNSEENFTTHLKASKMAMLEGIQHPFPMGKLSRVLELNRDLSRQPIISVLFNTASEMELESFGGLKVESGYLQNDFCAFDTFIHITYGKSGVDFKWVYNPSLWEAGSIQNRLQEFGTLLKGILANPQQSLATLPLLSEAVQQKMLVDWNSNEVAYPINQPVHCLFERQVERTPDNVAAVFEGNSMTYRELNESCNQLANQLRLEGLQTGQLVGICLERSMEMLMTIIAVVKAGGIYIPLDPVNPMDRLKGIVEDVEAPFLINQENKNGLTGIEGCKVLMIEDLLKDCKMASKANLQLEISPKQNAYIIFTSGSTGRPKGVGARHESVVGFLYAMNEVVNLTEKDTVFNVASMAFDPSVQDYFMTLMVGAKLVLASREAVMDGFLLREKLEEYQPTSMQATPSAWRLLLMAGWQGGQNLKAWSGGEGLTQELAWELVNRCKEVWNIYGPTETTIWATAKRVTKESLQSENNMGYVCVGKAITNYPLYLLDKNLQPVPVGIPGELYIGGVGVSDGYYNREDKTKECFVTSPLPLQRRGIYSGMVYKTGDICRYLANGDLEYLHRADYQVKIRGFRIELGEIEAAIGVFEGVQQNVVMAKEQVGGDKRLVAYVVMNPESTLDMGELKVFLKDKLPDYMVPSVFVELEEFPMTASRKVNRNLLPEPDYGELTSENEFVAPRTEMETMLAAFWKDLLQVKEVGVYDDFFELGGHSLIAVQLMAKIRQATDIKLPLASLLENATIAQLAKLLGGSEEDLQQHWSSLVPIKTKGKKLPIYLVHGAGLHVLLFKTLAKYLDAEQPVYALQAKGLDGKSEPLDTMESIATHYVSEILQHNPEGPYCLAGYSMGGLIAYEMARIMKEMGKEVQLLAMFDTVAATNRMELDGEQYEQAGGLKKWGRKVGYNLSLLVKNPVKTLAYKSSVLNRRLKRSKGKVANPTAVNGNVQQVEEQFTEYGNRIDQANMRAYENYVLRPLEVKIDLFRAKEQLFYVEDFEFLGWKSFAMGGVVVHEVEGNHLNLFDAPNGEIFARKLQGVLDS
ncbi:MAG: amino acid adenylation domain-containing protein [Chitinophagales bacterium]